MDKKLIEMTDLLTTRDQACILLKNGTLIYEDKGLGVKPLRKLRQQNFTKSPDDELILIDKVIGKGALMLAELIGVDEIYTPLTSEAALNYSEKCKIPVYSLKLVPFIENRDRTGMCPIENSVKETNDPVIGEQNIEKAIEFLMSQIKK